MTSVSTTPQSTPALRVVHVISSLAEASGGPSYAAAELVRRLPEHGCDVDLYTQDTSTRLGKDIPVDLSSIRVHKVRGSRLHRFLTPRRFRTSLARCATGASLIHVHGLWEGINHAACDVARDLGIPYIVSLHGMLEPWALSRSYWKKMLSLRFFNQRNLEGAKCLDAKSSTEAANIIKAGFGVPVSTIPIGLDVTQYEKPSDRALLDKTYPALAGKRILLFLSRVHPVKGLLNLAAAWGTLAEGFPGWHLVIAGPDEANHRAEVEAALRANKVFDRTTFTGSVSGDAKTQLYSLCDLFVLPTFSENFGVVVPEALASGCPVITTTGTPWKELEEYRCGWRVAIGAKPLENALREALSLTSEQRKAMGLRGREMVRQRFSWDTVARQTVALYLWACGKGPLPAYVQLPRDENSLAPASVETTDRRTL